MGMITDAITYNVRERGRKFRGVDRNLDTAALARIINGPVVQEMVKHGDMLGYFGHWPRVKFGMAPVEGGIIDGKAVALPIAVRTVELSATDDGNITHREEFLDTEAGKIAEGMYLSKAGGFSSAIMTLPRTSPGVPSGFYGFDYVYEPNYTTNRGHKVVLDSIGPELATMLDAVLEQAATEQAEMAVLFDGLMAQHHDALDALDKVERERNALLDRLSRVSGGDGRALLDSIMQDEGLRVAPVRVLSANPEEMYRCFRGVPLVALDKLPEPPAKPTAETHYAQKRFGVAI